MGENLYRFWLGKAPLERLQQHGFYRKKVDKLVLFKVKTICKLKTSYRLGKSIGKSHIGQGTFTHNI